MSDAGSDPAAPTRPAEDRTRAALVARLERAMGPDDVLLDEPMCEHTTFRVGGPADVYVTPDSPERVVAAVRICRELGVECLVVGRGSDLLVGDGGFRGVVVCTADAFDDLSVDGDRLVCQSGVTLADAAEMACALGLSGLEFACGIPGTVGGAVFMNAGAYDGQIADVLESARVLTPEGDVVEMGVGELDLGYRSSRVSAEGLVVLSATFRLARGEQDAIRARMDDLTRRREEKQPLELPSAGSTFKRPEGHFAGKLISDAGLQGFRVGGAEVSRKHAGFVVNVGGATASDVRAVIAHVQDEVERASGVRLQPEVRFVGEF